MFENLKEDKSCFDVTNSLILEFEYCSVRFDKNSYTSLNF